MRDLKPEERLIVAVDLKPDNGEDRQNVFMRFLTIVESLKGTGVYIKANSILRAVGYNLIDSVHNRGLKVFADLKLIDIPETLAIDGMLLREAKPELLTVSCLAGVKSMKALKNELPDTEVIGVTVLTHLTNDDSRAMFTVSTQAAVFRFSDLAVQAGLDGLVLSPAEAEFVQKMGIVLTINTPAIRPEWAIVSGDDQNPDRIMTPAKAIEAGADRIVVGRPITQAKNPYDAVMRTLDEMAQAVPANVQD